VDKGGYDYVMLQDQSILPTLNGTADDAGSAEQMTKMIKRVRKSSPDAKVSLEITWGRKFGNNNFGKYAKYIEKYPQFYSSYDAMQQRLMDVMTAEAEQNNAMLTPVGYAWQIVMHEREDINLYHKDNHHQSYAGSYLSAAVAYLTIYGEKFGENAANCKLDAATATYLRSVAERARLAPERNRSFAFLFYALDSALACEEVLLALFGDIDRHRLTHCACCRREDEQICLLNSRLRRRAPESLYARLCSSLLGICPACTVKEYHAACKASC
jgi:hypothetical protein